jgi:hypothetical protein
MGQMSKFLLIFETPTIRELVNWGMESDISHHIMMFGMWKRWNRTTFLRKLKDAQSGDRPITGVNPLLSR